MWRGIAPDGRGEEGTLERLKLLRRKLVDLEIAGHHGSIVKTTGDGILVEFTRGCLPLQREGAILSLERTGDAVSILIVASETD